MPFWLSVLALAAIGASQRWAVGSLHSLIFRLARRRDRAQVVLWIVLLPGVILHEASHWIAAKLLRVPCGKIRLFALGKGLGSSLRLGYMEVAKVDPLRNALVALAPSVAGLAAVYFIASSLALLPDAFNLPALTTKLWSVSARPWGWWDLGALYVLFAISSTAAPSQADLVSSRWLLVGALAVLVLMDALGWAGALPLGLDRALEALAFTAVACALVSVGVNLAVGLLAGAIDVTAALLLPRRAKG